MARAKRGATIAALIVAEAVRRGGGVVLTGGVTDLESLAARHDDVVIQPR